MELSAWALPQTQPRGLHDGHHRSIPSQDVEALAL
jgi:hypothetical protein